MQCSCRLWQASSEGDYQLSPSPWILSLQCFVWMSPSPVLLLFVPFVPLFSKLRIPREQGPHFPVVSAPGIPPTLSPLGGTHRTQIYITFLKRSPDGYSVQAQKKLLPSQFPEELYLSHSHVYALKVILNLTATWVLTRQATAAANLCLT